MDATSFVRELFTQPAADTAGITDLEVRRASLEDTYMALVRQAESGNGLADDMMTRRFSVAAG